MHLAPVSLLIYLIFKLFVLIVKRTSRLLFHTKETSSGQGTRHQVQRYCNQISSIINNFLPGCKDVQDILHARVPIIKYSQEIIGLECDLSFATSGYHMSELLYMYGELDNRVRPFVSVIRYWAKEHGLVIDRRPTPSFTNFMLTIMTIFFLQNRYKMLPPFNDLRNLADARKDEYACDDGVVCSYIRDISGLQPKLNSHWNWQPVLDRSNTSLVPTPNLEGSIEPLTLKQMLKDFFAFYAEFDYARGSICIRTGQIQPKNKIAGHKVNHRVSFNLQIINPLEPDLNVSSNVQERALNRFRIECQASLKKIEALQSNVMSELLKSESCSELFYVICDEDQKKMLNIDLIKKIKLKDNKINLERSKISLLSPSTGTNTENESNASVEDLHLNSSSKDYITPEKETRDFGDIDKTSESELRKTLKDFFDDGSFFAKESTTQNSIKEKSKGIQLGESIKKILQEDAVDADIKHDKRNKHLTSNKRERWKTKGNNSKLVDFFK